jgi:hypothetical protein
LSAFFCVVLFCPWDRSVPHTRVLLDVFRSFVDAEVSALEQIRGLVSKAEEKE